MSDIYCVKCGEAFDRDELHDWEGPNGEERTYSENMAAFTSEGCKGIGMTCNTVAAYGEDTGMIAGIMYDLMGDDLDSMGDMMDMARTMGFDVNV